MDGWMFCVSRQEPPLMWAAMLASTNMCLRPRQLESPCKHLSWTSTPWLRAGGPDSFSGELTLERGIYSSLKWTLTSSCLHFPGMFMIFFAFSAPPTQIRDVCCRTRICRCTSRTGLLQERWDYRLLSHLHGRLINMSAFHFLALLNLPFILHPFNLHDVRQ